MAAEEPPTNVPRIAEVQDPATSHYVVAVRMPTQLAAKYPDKPWGTAIDTIGLSKKESDRYVDYVLVSIEPLKGSPDLFWIFQKLDGPTWTTKSLGQESLIPQKYRRQITTVRSKQEVDPATEPTPITGDLTSSVVEQQDNTGKAVRVNTTEVIEENGSPLLGQQFAPNGALMSTSEQVVADGTSAAKGVNIAESTVDPLGNGKSIKQTSTAKKRPASGPDLEVEGWPKKQKKSKGIDNLTPQKYRGLITTATTTTQEALAQANVDNIPEPANPTGVETVIQHEKVNDYRYEKSITTEVIVEGSATLDGGKTSEWGVITSLERVVNEGDAVPHAAGIAQASITPFGNGKAEESKMLYPVANTAGIISSLVDQDEDAKTRVITDIEKYLVVNGTAFDKVIALATAKRAAGWYVERKAQDQFHTVLIASKIQSLPIDEVFEDTESVSLPDVLLSISPYFNIAQGAGTGTGKSSAEASASSNISPTAAINVRSGYSGKVRARITRKYSWGPPTAYVLPYEILPSVGSIVYRGTSQSFSVSLSGGPSSSRSVKVGSDSSSTKIGPYICNNKSQAWAQSKSTSAWATVSSKDVFFSVDATAVASASITCSIPNSVPASIVPGQLIARFQRVSDWRLGVWVREIVEVYAP